MTVAKLALAGPLVDDYSTRYLASVYYTPSLRPFRPTLMSTSSEPLLLCLTAQALPHNHVASTPALRRLALRRDLPTKTTAAAPTAARTPVENGEKTRARRGLAGVHWEGEETSDEADDIRADSRRSRPNHRQCSLSGVYSRYKRPPQRLESEGNAASRHVHKTLHSAPRPSFSPSQPEQAVKSPARSSAALRAPTLAEVEHSRAGAARSIPRGAYLVNPVTGEAWDVSDDEMVLPQDGPLSRWSTTTPSTENADGNQQQGATSDDDYGTAADPAFNSEGLLAALVTDLRTEELTDEQLARFNSLRGILSIERDALLTTTALVAGQENTIVDLSGSIRALAGKDKPYPTWDC
ncbi:hypothetical protein DFH06DRAFT_1351180 [Mycena polygramma]|nr:hypothetical protein DFH06DRAFT_1351180 [Mycena polygramma]